MQLFGGTTNTAFAKRLLPNNLCQTTFAVPIGFHSALGFKDKYMPRLISQCRTGFAFVVALNRSFKRTIKLS